MIEREMEDLLWLHPDKLLNENLKQFRRQQVSSVGRCDLIFETRLQHLLIIELKRGKLERGAIEQLHDYYGTLKIEFPDRPVELMVVANSIPEERRLACERLNIEWREISEKKFRDVASETGYEFKSESTKSAPATSSQETPAANERPTPNPLAAKYRIERGWIYAPQNTPPAFIAFVNAKGNCSMRVFDADSGAALRKMPGAGDYQECFQEVIQGGVAINIAQQPNLELAWKNGLPGSCLAELREQIKSQPKQE